MYSPNKEIHQLSSEWDFIKGKLKCMFVNKLIFFLLLTKTDTMSQLEAEQGLSDQHFDFIQQAVRKFCLIYGASLFFTSVKEDKNCDLLYKYLVHRNYNFPFNTPALVVERDAISFHPDVTFLEKFRYYLRICSSFDLIRITMKWSNHLIWGRNKCTTRT